MFEIEIITPEKLEYKGTPHMAVIPAVEGEMGVMANHENMLVALKEGSIIIYTKENLQDKAIEITGGFAEIGDNTCRILANKVV